MFSKIFSPGQRAPHGDGLQGPDGENRLGGQGAEGAPGQTSPAATAG